MMFFIDIYINIMIEKITIFFINPSNSIFNISREQKSGLSGFYSLFVYMKGGGHA